MLFNTSLKLVLFTWPANISTICEGGKDITQAALHSLLKYGVTYAI